MTASSPSPMAPSTSQPRWIKSLKSAQGGNCVEMRPSRGSVEVRDSKDPAGPTLKVTGAGFVRWLDCARSGALDQLRD